MSGYCKWCDTLTDDITQALDSDTNMLLWSGCLGCYKRRLELM